MAIFEAFPLDDNDLKIMGVELQKYNRISYYYLEDFIKLFKKGNLTKEYPLVANSLICAGRDNPFLNDFNKLIQFLEKNNLKGLKTIIGESKNKLDFYHSLSQLECAKFFIDNGFGVELCSDLLLRKKGIEIYIELKVFNEFDEFSLVMDSVRGIPSEYWLEIDSKVSTIAQVQKLKSEVEKRLRNPESFDLNHPLKLNMGGGLPDFAIIRFNKKDPDHKYKNTGLIIRTKDVITVDADLSRTKIKELLYTANFQLIKRYKSYPKFILFDLKNSKQSFVLNKDIDDFRNVVYGERTAISGGGDKRWIERTIQSTIKEENIGLHDMQCDIPEFKEVCKKYLMSRKSTVEGEPPFSYLSKKGLFFDDEYSYLNGILIRTPQGFSIFPNPFIDKNILIEEKKFGELFGPLNESEAN